MDTEPLTEARRAAGLGPTVLIVDDDPSGRGRMQLLCSLTRRAGSLQILTARSLEEATSALSSAVVHVILLDKNLGPTDDSQGSDGIEAIPRLLEIRPHAQIVVITASTATDDAARAVSLGAFWFLTKHTPDKLVVAQIDRALDVAEMTLSRARLERQPSAAVTEMAGTSVSLKMLKARIKLVADSSRPVLLLGETGTGKTTAARLIHEHRAHLRGQADSPFFAVNMGAISADLAERELFGNERGAYTDAKDARPGIFELADGGTLFLDEIGEASPDLQVKLLKAVEDGRFLRLGGSQYRKSSFKLICGTNRDLESKVAAGEFREDLYFRISTFPITIPPLSSRREDVPDIMRSLLPQCCTENNVFVAFEELPGDFVDYIKNTPLRGNVREIEQNLARLLVYAPKDRRGRPQLARWREILGLSAKRTSAAASVRTTLTLKDFESLPFDVARDDFPGLSDFLSLVSDKVILDAMARHRTLKDLSKALGVSMAKLSADRRRLRAGLSKAGKEMPTGTTQSPTEEFTQ